MTTLQFEPQTAELEQLRREMTSTSTDGQPSIEAREVWSAHMHTMLGLMISDEISAVPEDAERLRESLRQEREGDVRWEEGDASDASDDGGIGSATRA